MLRHSFGHVRHMVMKATDSTTLHPGSHNWEPTNLGLKFGRKSKNIDVAGHLDHQTMSFFLVHWSTETRSNQ